MYYFMCLGGNQNLLVVDPFSAATIDDVLRLAKIVTKRITCEPMMELPMYK